MTYQDQQTDGLVSITGCPRSGTKYASVVLQALGRDVQHERMGKDGISSWCLAVDADATPWGPSRRGISFRAALHQVRNPVLVIPSLSTLADVSWQFIYAHTSCRADQPVIVRCAKLWYEWNRHAEAVTEWRYQVERLADVFPEFCERVGVTTDPSVLDRLVPNINTRAFDGIPGICKRVFDKIRVEMPGFLRRRFADRSLYQRSCTFSWDALRALDRSTCEQVLDLAFHYGYTDAELQATPKAMSLC